ncbi:MAG: arginine--tRNA ligase [Bdellovibrionaceae bacterium]|nr:arginine--tRNA ligase [Pseudobdellovibrionaceae bacterium]
MLSSLKEQGQLSLIKQELNSYLKNFFLEEDIILEQARNPDHGHLSLPVFALAKKQKTSPQNLAQKLSAEINKSPPSFLKSCQPLAGFINFYFKTSYIQKYLDQFGRKTNLMQFKNEKSPHLIMDFASPNVAKFMNIGHLRATVLGQALVNLAKAFGFKVTAVNHLGDWGSQFGKLLWAYKKWKNDYDFKTQAFESLVKLYVRFYKSAEQDEKNLESARQLFKQLEQGDKELKKLWEWFVSLSLKNYENYWKLLNVKHDIVLGESFYIKFMEDLKSRLTEKALLLKSEGAQVVFLDISSTPCLIFKTDGASTYSARDLCSLIYRFETLKADQNIYITGSDQNLHFKQIFEVAQKLNSKFDKNLHLSFGMYRFKGEGKMSSRQGQAVYLKDILSQAIDRVKKIIEERNPSLEDKDKISQEVAIGAVVFNDLVQDRIKDVDFDWSKVLDFNGDTGPFVQYSLVRANSLLKKANFDSIKKFDSCFDPTEEFLAWKLLSFEWACFQSLQKFKPHILARYLVDLSKEFNRFYNQNRILGSEKESDRLLLTHITYKTLFRGLEILNIPRPQAM